MAYLVSDEPIQVILAESHLPGGVNGISLLRDACRIRPGIHALLTCRASDAEAEGNGPKDEGLEVLTKPYQPSDLVHLIGALLKSATFSAETEEMLAEVRDIGAPGPSLATLNLSADKAAGTYEARRTAIRLGVMPFKTIKTTGDDTSFSLGLAEEITGAFARFRWLTCVSSASVATIYSEPSQTSAWQELDLDFLVTGTLRTEANRISIQVRLLNMRGSGELIWSRGFDSSLLDVLNLQERIAAETVAQIAPEVLVWEAETVLLRPQINPSAYELMLRAIPAIYRLDQETFRAAGALLASSLKADPSSAACHSWLAHWYLLLIGQGWAEDVADASHRAGQLAQQAIALDPGDARGFTVAGHIEAFLHRKAEDALGLHERAIALNPNLALAWCYSGLAHCYLGQHTDAVRHVERARRLSPHDPHGFFFDMALAMPFLLSGDYEIAAQLGRRARHAHPGFSSTYKGLLACPRIPWARQRSGPVARKAIGVGAAVLGSRRGSPVAATAGRRTSKDMLMGFGWRASPKGRSFRSTSRLRFTERTDAVTALASGHSIVAKSALGVLVRCDDALVVRVPVFIAHRSHVGHDGCRT